MAAQEAHERRDDDGLATMLAACAQRLAGGVNNYAEELFELGIRNSKVAREGCARGLSGYAVLLADVAATIEELIAPDVADEAEGGER